ncbi:XRE family transcriptional regulator [Moraxella bovis]|uniref:Helix-turn-helix domain-containing protein n=1 Tax=Moraxella bovis TaxID=476 RepID=A0AAQ2QCY1_MORBO|nr:XRE family transcriptional regulator [Moraxella bovis]UYZ76845.1 helix-turn-helix domain-containing protein [Moraxella bovis]UYZ77205.1 helix-turn-helix domain-containing protein [Moraxella bovis]UYZ85685.1 helix-turn-helix domain-containing protein [Moraxella bovis]UYZ91115.1 helix-turn-helix domain-containing protein [Moraxella bovis]UYZ98967.1 helix-turn-helix domain-containing protein [Moraxella bovis]
MNRQKIGTRLQQVREQSGLGRATVCEKVGIGTTTLRQWEVGATEVSLETLEKLARLYKVSPQYLIFGTDGDTLPPEPTSTSDDEYHYVPYFRGVIASAGGGKFSDGVIGTDDFLAFRKEWINRTSLTASQLVAINTDGDSMFPTIPENATVLIDKSKDTAKDGRIYVIRIGEQLYVKRTQWLPTGLRLISDNTIYDPIDLSKADLDSSDIEIYGQVVHISYDLPH